MGLGWMNTLVLVRHGESVANVASRRARSKGLEVGWDGVRQADIVLSARGVKQAVATGKWLDKRFVFHRVFVSPYARTIESAQQICQQFAYEAQLRYDERIRERELGILDGLTHQGIARKYPEEWKRMRREGPYYYRAPGGESYPDVALRVYSFILSMRQNFVGKDLLVVTHGNAIWAFRRVLERLDEPNLVKMQSDPSQRVYNCSIFGYEHEAMPQPGAPHMALRHCAVVAYRRQALVLGARASLMHTFN